jgi:hypothetical protein
MATQCFSYHVQLLAFVYRRSVLAHMVLQI